GREAGWKGVSRAIRRSVRWRRGEWSRKGGDFAGWVSGDGTGWGEVALEEAAGGLQECVKCGGSEVRSVVEALENGDPAGAVCGFLESGGSGVGEGEG